MSIRLSGVYLVPAAPTANNEPNNEKNSQPGENETNNQLRAAQYHYHNHQSKTVTIVAAAGPQRSNSLDYLNFEEKRQIIASSLSLSDFLAHGPAAAAKEVAASTVVIGKSPKSPKSPIFHGPITSRPRVPALTNLSRWNVPLSSGAQPSSSALWEILYLRLGIDTLPWSVHP
jgi:hypothetical protein